MTETGVIKFHCEHVPLQLDGFAGFDELSRCRRRLVELGLVGVDANGIGYGNLSTRGTADDFYITGSGTAALLEVRPADCARVVWYDSAANRLRCEGALASSESLTHAAIYQADTSVRVVIHCHAREMWERLRNVLPTTSAAVEYGTPQMASEVARLFAETSVRRDRVFVMGGHQDGVIAFGATFRDAFEALRSSSSGDIEPNHRE